MTGTTWVVVPCYDEADRLPGAAFRDYAQAHPEYRFRFVDDGSRDLTAEVLAALCQSGPGLTWLALPENRGKAEAVRAGMLSVLADDQDAQFFGYWDADLATPLDALPLFGAVFADQPEVALVMGARVALLGRKIDRSPLRHYVGRIFATAASRTLGLPVYDTQCGAKLFRVSATTASLFEQPFISGWSFDVELIARLIQALPPDGPGAETVIHELPLPVWRDVDGSKVRPLDFFTSLYSLLRIHDTYRR